MVDESRAALPSGAATWVSEVCVIGAGAAGLWAAAEAARRGAQVLLIEKTRRTGTKVLASGGTRCNLTTTLGPEEAARLFRRGGERFLRSAFRALPPAEVRRRFEAWGVPTDAAPLEKIFPTSGRARDVRDALEREAREAGVRIELEAPVLGLASETLPALDGLPEGNGWRVRVAGERSALCRRLILCSGGASYPSSGTTGEGYGWLADLDLPIHPIRPALVPLRSPAQWVHELTGLAWQGAELRLVDGRGKLLGRRRRPVLFTHQGLSGPAAMDLSVHVAPPQDGALVQESRLLIDFFPDTTREGMRDILVESAGAKGAPYIGRCLPEPVPRRLLAAICKQAGLSEVNLRAHGLNKASRHALVESLKGLSVPIQGTLGFNAAEVTAGGLDLRRVDPRTMAVKGHPGLYVIGELLDLDGPIGGLNFQAAFACAQLAAGHAASG